MKSDALYAETIVNRLAQLFGKYRAVFWGTFLFGFLTHGFAFTSKLINHDDVHFLFSLGTTVQSGRWGLKLLEYILPNFSMPWINGVLTLALISVSVCFMVETFELKRPLFQFLIGALVVSFPSLTGTFTYMFTSVAYGVSFLLSVISAWIVVKRRGSWVAIGVLLLAFSVGIYQAYLSMNVALLVLAVLQKLLRKEKLEHIFAQGMRYLLFLILSLGIYVLVHRIVLDTLGIGLGEYAQGITISGGLGAVLQRIYLPTERFIMYFLSNSRGLIAPGFSTLLHWLLLLASTMLLVLWCIRMKEWIYAAILFLVLIVYATGVNCLYLIFYENCIHTLVLYGVVTIYLLFILVLDEALENYAEQGNILRTGKKLLAEVSVVCMLLVAVSNAFLGNQVYLKLHLKYENTYTFYTTIMARIQEQEDFDASTKLAILGVYPESSFYDMYFSDIRYITGAGGVAPVQYSEADFVRYYIGLEIPFASDEEINEIIQTEKFAEMACYPYSGSIEKIGSCMVVKLSNVEPEK